LSKEQSTYRTCKPDQSYNQMVQFSTFLVSGLTSSQRCDRTWCRMPQEKPHKWKRGVQWVSKFWTFEFWFLNSLAIWFLNQCSNGQSFKNGQFWFTDPNCSFGPSCKTLKKAIWIWINEKQTKNLTYSGDPNTMGI
jgi:hypothetical protein